VKDVILGETLRLKVKCLSRKKLW